MERKTRFVAQATSARDYHYFSITPRSNRDATAHQLDREFHESTRRRISSIILSIRLHERGLLARTPAVCVPLTYTNRIYVFGSAEIIHIRAQINGGPLF